MLGELAVRPGLAERDLAQRGPDALLERRAVQLQRQVEAVATAVEVLLQLPGHLGERLLGRPGQPLAEGGLLRPVPLRLHVEADQPVALGDQGERAVRAVDHGVGAPRGCGGRAHALLLLPFN